MPLIERYILRQASLSFISALMSLTAIVWVTQVLREFDLVTAQGQSLFTLMHVTGLWLPSLMVVMAPVALFIAVAYTLVRLNTDSELVSMHAAGMSYIRLAKPLLLLSILVCGFMAWMTLDAVPRSFRGLRDLLTLVRTDVVSNVVREGRFTQLEKGLTFHVKERTAKGILQGIFVQDRREPDQILTYIAERGMVMEEGEAVYLMLEKGSLQRQSGPKADAALVAFDRYAIDLSQFAAATNAIVYKPRERTTQDLLNPDEGEDYYQRQKGRFRAELHERFSGPLYVLAFALLGYGILGVPQTTRQGRAVSLISAVIIIAGLRMAGFSVSSLVVRNASAVPLMYAIPLSGIVLGAYVVWQRGRHLQPLRSIPLLRGVG